MIRRSFLRAGAGLGLLGAGPSLAQPGGPAAGSDVSLASLPLASPEVGADRRATLRVRAPHAREVAAVVEYGTPQPMRRGADGVWSLTLGPLEPDVYTYTFSIDGTSHPDPLNRALKTAFNGLGESLLEVRSATPQPWNVQDVPHGALTRHPHRSALIGDRREFFVYTPPGYGVCGTRDYPVLYLLHGFGDDAAGWSTVGRQTEILDHLIAAGRVPPMLIVNPLGYGAPEIMQPGGRDRPGLMQKNLDRMSRFVLEELVPTVEARYRTSRRPERRAVAGLSMGGAQALQLGLNRPDVFGHVGAFSAATPMLESGLEANFPGLGPGINRALKTLWLACGEKDALIEPNRRLAAFLRDRGVRHTWRETPGGHSWPVWRRHLIAFAPLLFRA